MKGLVPGDRPILVETLLSVLAFTNRLEFGNRGLTRTEWTALSEIPSEGAGLSQKRLIARTGLATQRLGATVAKLVARGLVQEIAGRVDSDSQRFLLSSSGQVLRNEILEVFAKVEADELDQSQLQALIRSARVVRRLSRRLDEVEVQDESAPTEIRLDAQPQR
jgi:DNA-binding MarR family transcriptional regulator